MIIEEREREKEELINYIKKIEKKIENIEKEKKNIKEEYDTQNQMITDFILSLDCESLDDIRDTFLQMEEYLNKLSEYDIKSSDELYNIIDNYKNIQEVLKEYKINDLKKYLNNIDNNISEIYDHDLLMTNQLYKSLSIINSKLVKENKENNKIIEDIKSLGFESWDDFIKDYNNNNKENEIKNTPIINFTPAHKMDKQLNTPIINFTPAHKMDKQLNTPKNNNYYKRCKYELCNNYIINNHIYCNYHFIEENKKIDNIKNNTNKYKLKILTKDIPIIIEHYKYEQNNLSDYQLVPYFNINNYYKELILLFNKYNLSFKIKKQSSKVIEKENKPKRNDYGHIDQDAEINKILDKLVKSRNIANRRYPNNNINVKANRYKMELYSDYYINSNKYNEEEKQLFFEQENLKYNNGNKSRFEKYTRIFNKFHNDEIITNSDYVFLPNTFKNVNNKYIDSLVYKIKLLINKKYTLDEIKENKFLDERSSDDEEYSEEEERIMYCWLCKRNESLKDDPNGFCTRCREVMDKPKND